MYIIVTQSAKIADEAKVLGATVFEVPESKNYATRLILKERESDQVIKILQMFAFKPNLKGYAYLKCILEKCAVDNKYHQSSMIQVIYPGVAKKFGTTMSRVERALRHAIDTSFREVPARYNEIFNRELSHAPTNSEFISMLSEYLAHVNA